MRTAKVRTWQVAVAVLALGASGMAAADGITGKLAGRAGEQVQQQRQSRNESRPAPRSESRPEPRQQQAPRNEVRAEPRQQAPRNEARAEPRQQAPRNEPRAGAGNESRNPGSDPRQQRPSRETASAPATSPRGDRPRPAREEAGPQRPQGAAPGNAPSNNRPRNNASGGDRGVVGGLVQREYGNGNARPRNPRDRDHEAGPRRDHDHYNHRPRRPVHVIHHLPGGYRDYFWNGSHYYYHGGHWYRPYGTSYISVGVPYGFFVTTLPGSFTSIWVGGTRYYYSDDYYYVYEPERRGYVVVRSPYGDEEEEFDDDLYIYPAQGQSEQQQADDRYDCHRWAVNETDYDPIDDEYDADLRQNYLRAMTACLTGRGYTVR